LKHKKGNPIHGWLVFDKPIGMSSAQAVAFVKRAFNAQKAGHGGTLDPLASGVLPIALGEATKTMSYVLGADKYYSFEITFGEERKTDDCEGEVIQSSDKRPSEQDILAVIPQFLGEIQQIPPLYSAVKIAGKPAYARARNGEDIKIEAKTITVNTLELISFDGDGSNITQATFEMHAGKGTYVRSIARDMGRILGCYAYVSKLKRTKAGKFEISEAISKEKLDLCLEKGQGADKFLLDIGTVLDDIPAYGASNEELDDFKVGKQLVRMHLKPGLMRVMSPNNKLLSLVDVGLAGEMKIVRNFNIV
jgi:tRNA pseudouridine55 synthase